MGEWVSPALKDGEAPSPGLSFLAGMRLNILCFRHLPESC